MKKIVKILFIFAISLVSVAQVMAQPLPIYQGVGGDFNMDSTLGKRVSLSDFDNKVVLLTFGYTNCSDVCPVTLGFLNNALNKVEAAANNTQVLFVSVDPDYDTIEHLTKYLAYFNENFIGLTGTKQEIETAVKKYNIRYTKTSELQVSTQYRKNKIPKDTASINAASDADEHRGHHAGHHKGHHGKHDTSSLYSHSTYIYLLDKQAQVRGIYDTTTSPEKLAIAIDSVITE